MLKNEEFVNIWVLRGRNSAYNQQYKNDVYVSLSHVIAGRWYIGGTIPSKPVQEVVLLKENPKVSA